MNKGSPQLARAEGSCAARRRTRAWLVAAPLSVLGLLLAGWAVLAAWGGPRSVRAQSQEEEFKPTIDEYVVQKGDNLWDVCQAVVGKGYLWPKVWAFNPEITNPNFIYPGDIIRFYPRTEPLPAFSPLLAADGSRMPGAPARATSDEITRRTDEESRDETGGPRVEVIDTRPPPVRRTETSVPRRNYSGLFITPQELLQSGVVTNSAQDKMMLTTGDRIFITFPEGRPSKVGDRYRVYRTVEPVNHPVTKLRFGYMTQVTALATIEMVDGNLSRARLDKAVFEVERGQLVTPQSEDVIPEIKPIDSTPVRVQGVVVAVEGRSAVLAGPNQLVFVDKGKNDGLVPGHRLQVMERGDPVTHRIEQMPFTRFATLVVVDAKETAATCLVVDSRREVVPGDAILVLTR